jgi:putative cell wall-binding protein
MEYLNKKIPILKEQIKNIFLTNNIILQNEKIQLIPISFEYAEQIFQSFTPEITTYMSPAPAKKISETLEYIKKQ